MLCDLADDDAHYVRCARKIDDNRVFIEVTVKGHRARYWRRNAGRIGHGDIIELRAMGSPRTIRIEFVGGYIQAKRGSWVSLQAMQRPARAILWQLDKIASAPS
ncbi:MAG: hypothetical protein O3B64_03660 [bacterium]|nr:hypothetical protein [bacterium]